VLRHHFYRHTSYVAPTHRRASHGSRLRVGRMILVNKATAVRRSSCSRMPSCLLSLHWNTAARKDDGVGTGCGGVISARLPEHPSPSARLLAPLASTPDINLVAISPVIDIVNQTTCVAEVFAPCLRRSAAFVVTNLFPWSWGRPQVRIDGRLRDADIDIPTLNACA
jgi:hypothetical protein